MSRHRFDAVSFVFGALFTGVAVLGLTGLWSLAALDLTWLGPGLLILLGLVVLATAVSRGRGPGEPAASAEAPGGAGDPGAGGDSGAGGDPGDPGDAEEIEPRFSPPGEPLSGDDRPEEPRREG